MRMRWVVPAALVLTSCIGMIGELPDGDGGVSDGGADAAVEDAGVEPGDSGADAGESDAGFDGGDSDAGLEDAGDSDAGVEDAGDTDAGADAGRADAGVDAGRPDAGIDAGRPDAGIDAGRPDAGVDAGPGFDAGTDGGSTNPDAGPCNSARLVWDVTPLTADGGCSPTLDGFKVYWGPRTGTYTDVVTLDYANPALVCTPNGMTTSCGPSKSCAYEVTNLPAATWYFAVTAHLQGNESGYSGEAVKTVTCGAALPSCPDEGSTITNSIGFYSAGSPEQWMYDGYAYRNANFETTYVLVMVASAPWSLGAHPFTATETSAATCKFCVKAYKGKVTYMPMAGGTFNFTALDPAIGGHYAGSVSGLVLQEVTIDPMNESTTPVDGGLRQCLGNYSWNVVTE